jgi:nitroimidazol reductase NimA-like FMN-containing flavoprotein (pyridoxamine 5'-phosphate oxidase superfamily)
MEFRKMRRSAQQLSPEETLAILDRGSCGVLALAGDGGYPYAVPMSYVRAGDKLYFHGARTGHRADAVRRCGKASFCVVDQDEVDAERFTTLYRSAVVFGVVRRIEDPAAMRAACLLLAEKYSPGRREAAEAETEREFPALAVYELTMEHVTGKEGVELTRARRNG